MQQINEPEDLPRDSEALAPLVQSDASAHQPEADEPLAGESDAPAAVIDEFPLDDTAAGSWMRADVMAYARMQTEPFTSSDVLVDALHMVRDDGPQWKAGEMAVAKILRELGYDRHQRRVNGERQNLWSKLAEPQDEATQAAHVDQTPFLTETPNTVIGDAADDDVGNAPSTSAEPAKPTEPAESACTRYQEMTARQTEIKRKLADAKRASHFATESRKKAALAAVDGGFKAEADYYKAVEADKAASAHVEQLTAALESLDSDLQRASLYAEAERRVQQCNAVRDMARVVEGYGPRIEGLLVDLGKAVSGYMHDINVVYRRSWSVMTGAREVAAPQTDPVACALMGQFLRSSGLDPEFFTDLTSHGMNGLLRYESPSQIVDMQLANITDRLVDNYMDMIVVREGEPEAEDDDCNAAARAYPNFCVRGIN
ncbi:hypothetical protein [Burkholderia seminalis]|uniref:hypothetical protein n=1 Tax=Burkholderia seminalis TaxID=488731 RepID=UPI00145301C6|nr:hypothetical protein [Burkholderia seminalis]MCA8435357.1 hypothetical protein [Burkholderia seminalis]VWC35935.1 hypothetical protein BSE24067_06684 [Burkholderia seminalis]